VLCVRVCGVFLSGSVRAETKASTTKINTPCRPDTHYGQRLKHITPYPEGKDRCLFNFGFRLVDCLYFFGPFFLSSFFLFFWFFFCKNISSNFLKLFCPPDTVSDRKKLKTQRAPTRITGFSGKFRVRLFVFRIFFPSPEAMIDFCRAQS
jgi:hypothetical protein